jgi:hypothetical protein
MHYLDWIEGLDSGLFVLECLLNLLLHSVLEGVGVLGAVDVRDHAIERTPPRLEYSDSREVSKVVRFICGSGISLATATAPRGVGRAVLPQGLALTYEGFEGAHHLARFRAG